MGSNIIYLADVRALNVPSYRRLRASGADGAAKAAGSWAAAARERAAASSAATHAAPPPSGRPLRTTQLVGSGALPGGGACLRISGRLIDVCAELERLAAAEAMAARRA